MPTRPRPAVKPAAISPHDLPDLGLQLGQITGQLAQKGQLGVLSITVLQREGGSIEKSWDDYETTLQELTQYLSSYAKRKMRRGDVLLEPIVAGNTFLLFFDPPRKARSLDTTDIIRVRHRLTRSINTHLVQRLSHAAVERFGVYVGGALVKHDPSVDSRRLVYRSLEAAFADALGQKKNEGRRNAVHLRRILASGRLDVVFQPLIDLLQRRVLGYEALTRVQESKFQSPDLLFKAAHENGALWELEQLSRRRALECIPTFSNDQLLFMNIEPDSIHDPELVDGEFLRQVKAAGLSPRQIVLEMTEHCAVKDFEALRAMLKRFRSVGFRLAMDDVGSGYSGLQAIAEIAPDFLKVDMGLVRDLDRNPIKRELIATIRRFTDSTGIVLVAEGVERPEELQSLASIGVRCAQGFLFARPAPSPEEPDWERLRQILTEEPA